MAHPIASGRERLPVRSRHDSAGGVVSLLFRVGILPSPTVVPPTLVPPVSRPRLPGLREQEQYQGKNTRRSLSSPGSGSLHRLLVLPPDRPLPRAPCLRGRVSWQFLARILTPGSVCSSAQAA